MPMKKHILCIGDSNTHGYCADPADCADGGARFNENERWTCVLQKLLGEDYLVDIAVIYVVLSLIAVLLLCRIYINLFDKEKGMYFEGLNTPSEFDFSDWKWMVANVEKRYYLK